MERPVPEVSLFTILLLAEHSLTDHDVDRVAHLHDPEPVAVHLLVPGQETGAVEASVGALRAAGVAADGEPVRDPDPVPAVTAAAGRLEADEVIVLTEPHVLETAFHRDWASRLRDELHLPVLHAVAGTDQVVS